VETSIKFEPSGKSSLVASGQTISGAARSLGVDIPLECGGIGKCDSCAVKAESGADGISELTDAERTYLNQERLAAGERLACQAHLLGPEVVVRVPTAEERAEKKAENAEQGRASDPRVNQIREEFEKLPLDKKVSALAELGVNAAGDIVGELLNVGKRIGNDLSSIFSGPAKTEPPPDPDSTETKTDSDEKGNS